MMLSFLLAYVLGGLTFIPLLLAVVFAHAYLTLPVQQTESSDSTDIKDELDDGRNIQSQPAPDLEKFRRTTEPDVAQGFFAVCREFVAGGVNGKPPERATPAGEMAQDESPSVYQSMYRSIFDRKTAPSLETTKSTGMFAKKARNVFYVVLRHGHLMLYDNVDQVEVRHVISLAHHDVSVFAGGGEIPEGELWLKRNAIKLARKPSSLGLTPITKPFYLFCDNCSEKEDFYFALLKNQERSKTENDGPPEALVFDTPHMVSLVQRLHSSEDQMQSRWLNAMLGRVFLAVYKTQAMENFVRNKFAKKISRVKIPSFLSSITLNRIDMGTAAPTITNPKLKDLTIDGECSIEADFHYEGGFLIEVATTAKIDLGTRFKAREVQLVLAAKLKKLSGHIFVKLKPPPSNRIWFTFETMPHLEMSIEPVISSRQVTYSIILRAIESRIREVLAESLVYPNFDDICFHETMDPAPRGGIWATERGGQDNAESKVEIASQDETLPLNVDGAKDELKPRTTAEDRSYSSPQLAEVTGLQKRKGHKTAVSLDVESPPSKSTAYDASERPRALRSTSFATIAAEPIVSVDHGTGMAGRDDRDAASSIQDIANRSHPASPIHTPLGSLETPSGEFMAPTLRKASSVASNASIETQATKTSAAGSSTHSNSSTPSALQTRFSSFAKSLTPSEQKKQQLAASYAATSAAAKNWAWSKKQSFKSAAERRVEALHGFDQPVGAGRPLPPIGQPLPGPESSTPTPIAIPKRKPVTASRKPVPPPRPAGANHSSSASMSSIDETVLVIPPPNTEDTPNNVSESESPEEDTFGEFLDNVEDDETESAAITSNTRPHTLEPLVQVETVRADEALRSPVPSIHLNDDTEPPPLSLLRSAHQTSPYLKARNHNHVYRTDYLNHDDDHNFIDERHDFDNTLMEM